MRPARLANTLLAVLGALVLQGCDFGERDDILVLVRADDPISKAIGDYYAETHDIPTHRVLSLTLSNPSIPSNPSNSSDPSNAAVRNEIDHSTFDSEIAAPIESYLAATDPDRDVSILVTTLGIPVRIGHCESNEPHYPRDCRASAVDAALAGLGRLVTTADPIDPATGQRRAGRLEGNANPYFGDPRPFEEFRRAEPTAKLRFLVARLSGPAALDESGSKLPIALRRLIDGEPNPTPQDTPVWQIIANAPTASRDPASRALIDPIHDLQSRNGHSVCDGCALSTGSGAPSGVVFQREHPDDVAATMPEGLAFPGLVIALGSLANEARPLDRYLGDWLSRGARALSLHLDDPSLGGVTRPAMLLHAWTEGRTAVEAHFNSVPHLGWTNVFVGDPLLTMANSTSPTKAEREDRDHDGIRDEEDNCRGVANPDQRDSNRDGIGNRCDPDVNNDGRVDTSWGRIYPVDQRGDLESIALTARNGPFDPDHDLDGDGVVDDRDLALAQLWLFRRPGPSGAR
jgi:hypothetical protein